MDLHALYHRPKSEYAYAYNHEALHLLLRTKKDDVSLVELRYGDPFMWEKNEHQKSRWVFHQIPMKKRYQTSDYDYYFVHIQPEYLRTKYVFILHDDHKTYSFGPRGLHLLEDKHQDDLSAYFNFPYVHQEDLHHTPSWVKDTIWYQIFPDRFRSDNEVLMATWKDAPVNNSTHLGGNLKGMTLELPRLHELGINGIYLTPIFTSPSVHKYDTTDYFSVDPHFGTNEDFKIFVQTAHHYGIKVMLDGVFNHAGFLHPFFQDLIKHNEESTYKDCFYVDQFPVLHFPLSEAGKPVLKPGQKPHYRTFAFQPSMPKWNTSHPLVASYLLDVVRYWIEVYDIDGWRLDVSNELSHAFLRNIKKTARSVKEDCFILGENWDQSLPWLLGDQLDSVMNYELSYAIWHYLSLEIDTIKFKDQLNQVYATTPDHVMENMFNLLGSHDTMRIRKRLSDDLSLVKLAFILLFINKGTPMIYYGDEYGMTGDHDPDNRRPLLAERFYDKSFYAFIKHLIYLRKTYQSLFLSDFICIEGNPLILMKKHGSQTLLCIINPHESCEFDASHELIGRYRDLINDKEIEFRDTIKIDSKGYYLLYKEESS